MKFDLGLKQGDLGFDLSLFISKFGIFSIGLILRQRLHYPVWMQATPWSTCL